MNIVNAKKTVYSRLSTISSITVDSETLDIVVSQRYEPQNVDFAKKIYIAFGITNYIPGYSLEKDIEVEDIEFTIHIFAKNSKFTTLTLEEIKGKLILDDLRLIVGRDVPEPSEGVSHLVSIFKF